jgi:molybdopterin synthase catalytic subunit
VGEASVAVAVSSAHRQAAFEAGQWLIDTLKQSVPIWKRELWADGSSEWVHPGMDRAPAEPSIVPAPHEVRP